MANEQSSSAITTYSGVRFDPLEPAPDRIRFEDVAHGLSQTCRFSDRARSSTRSGRTRCT
ncbi:hypothetical protein D8S78_06345 [Natrialba swarupiae]|nr:hypothetical protein [Natrialba swarupiae]